jgi:hypothetical protein
MRLAERLLLGRFSTLMVLRLRSVEYGKGDQGADDGQGGGWYDDDWGEDVYQGTEGWHGEQVEYDGSVVDTIGDGISLEWDPTPSYIDEDYSPFGYGLVTGWQAGEEVDEQVEV